ncbi:MAG TPA: ATP-dependent endonuclease, partial [Clostridium sp.]|nr:ATP-dependent endonuclease [Clostridium sp.]
NANVFSNTLNGSKPWPVQFVVSTHSTHIANEAKFESIRYFFTSNGKIPETKIKDLNVEFNVPENKKDKEFIHKYLTLTRCDLFFADKAMLIEGPTERLLMPMLIKKTDEEIMGLKLESQYISIVEIGGAYAHHFYKFLDFLELKTLIITDLDSTKKTLSKSKKDKIVYPACVVSSGTHTSNAGIKNWFKKTDEFIDLSEIRNNIESSKIKCTRRIAFQIPEQGKTACGRSFEDAFILANRELFDIKNKKEDKAEKTAYAKAEKYKKNKTDFALQYAFDNTTWNVPLYIKEGLVWLAEAPKDEESKLLENNLFKGN